MADVPDPGIQITAPADVGPKLTPVDHDPFAKDGKAEPKLTPVSHDPFATKSSISDAAKKDDSFTGGIKRGFLERGTGVDEALNQMGVGGAVPVFKNGKLSFGLPPNEELAKQMQNLEAQGRGTGAEGELAEQIGDPVNYLGYGVGKAGTAIAKGAETVGKAALKKMTAEGGIQAALSGSMAGSTDKKQTGIDRMENTAMSALAGSGLGAALGKIGSAAALGGKPTGDVIKATPLNTALKKLGVTLTGKESAEEVWTKIQGAVKDKVSEVADKASPGSAASKMWSVGVNLATSKMYQATRQAGGILYDQARKLGENLEAPVKDLKTDIDKIISNAEKDTLSANVNPKFNTALQKLRDLKDNLANNAQKGVGDDPWNKILHIMQHGDQKEETVNGTQLIELDQTLNELYGKKGAGGRLYDQLQTKVNGAIKQMSPEFGAAYQKAKDYWRQNVEQGFKENKTLGKYWKKEDYEAYEAMSKGIALNPNLKARVNDMLDKISSPLELGELKNSLPPEMYDNVRASKFIQLMDKSGLDAKALSNENNYNLIAKSLEHKPEQLQALDAIQTFTQEMNDRGVGRQLSTEELRKSDKLLDRSMRTIFSLAVGHKLYALKHVMEKVTGADSPNAIQGKLTGLAKEAAGGASKAELGPSAAASAVNTVGATSTGDDVDMPHITITKEKQ